MARTILAALLIVLLGACKPPEDSVASASRLPAGMKITIATASSPVVGRHPLTVRILSEDEPVAGASVTVTGDMTHAGMVPVIADASEAEAGRYVIEDFHFNMGGDWFLTADIILPDGSRVSAVQPVTVASR